MKYISFLILPVLSFIIVSCNEPDPMPPVTGYSIDRIYSINLDGSGLKLITTGSDFSLLPNGKIIYINNSKLYSCNSDGTDDVIISPNSFDVYNYMFYLNSTKILIYSNASFYSMNLDGSGFSQLNFPSNIKINNYITLSPDGQKLAYANSSGLYIINSDGSNQIQIQDSANTFSFPDINFTPDGNNVVYLQDFRNGNAQDLGLYNVNSKYDTSLFYGTNGNWARTYCLSKWNTLLFSNGNGVNLMNLNNYSYTFLHSGGDAHFSNDSTKITFTDLNNSIYVMDLKDYSTKYMLVNLPKNYISNPLLSLDENHVFFQADTSWSVIQKKSSNNNIVY